MDRRQPLPNRVMSELPVIHNRDTNRLERELEPICPRVGTSILGEGNKFAKEISTPAKQAIISRMISDS
jgi:hypothetical protein